MDVFLLGAGRPAHGKKPSALKNITLSTTAMDWQIHSFAAITELNNIHYLGGYHVDDVIKCYPQLNFTVIPDWQQKGVLHTLLKAPFSDGPVVVAYSDTLFRKDQITDILSVDADIVFCIDSLWKERYVSRTVEDIRVAELINLKDFDQPACEVEFTGLMHLQPEVVACLRTLDESGVGSSLVDLVVYLKNKGFSVKSFDVTGHWAEFNSPDDIARFILGSKAETLARLEPRVTKSHIGKQVNFTVADWQLDANRVLNRIADSFAQVNLVIRSSSKGEDNWYSSNAGGFTSVLNINCHSRSEIVNAIESVIASYGINKNQHDQVLVQEYVSRVQLSGVAFTCGLESGSPYYRFNFDDKTQSTESVTTGTNSDLRTIILSRFGTAYLKQIEPGLIKVLEAIEELEQLLEYDKLDVEFAINTEGQVHIFQVRPITVDHSMYELDLTEIQSSLQQSIGLFTTQQYPGPFVQGNKTVFANMPDWNPAEIIGTRPKPLAFSLYRHLISNDIWAQQRAEYGYRDIRPAALIYSFSGQPYVDVRASINSFIPASLSCETTSRLANAYLNILLDNPQYHDKIEFAVVFTVWIPQFRDLAKARLSPYGVTPGDIASLEAALKQLTCVALTRLHSDIATIYQLNQRRKNIIDSKIPVVDKLIALISDCKHFGTLAFAHAARAGFVATTILNSLVATGALTEQRRLAFLNSFSTVAGDFEQEKQAYLQNSFTLSELIEKYGHLRPGTYDLMAKAYWEDASCYLIPEQESAVNASLPFVLTSTEQLKFSELLNELGSTLTVTDFRTYLVEAIQAREFVKFDFTKSLSCSLDLCIQLGIDKGMSREDMAYLEYQDLKQLKLNICDASLLLQLIESRKQHYALTCAIELPSMICNETDFYAFERLSSQPNFVTINRVEAEVQCLDLVDARDLKGKVILISQADPGYDWLFGQGIAGLITQYGGANSHMAIRSAEIGLPAAIGVGEKLYERICRMTRLELDCANQVIRQIQ